MELRPADKLIILMLTEIYDHLKVQGETDTAFLRNAIFGGHNWALDWQLPGITQTVTTPETVVRRTVDLLDMYDMLERSFEALPTEGRTGIEDWAIQFRGFDGNNESDHMSVARFLVEQMDRFTRFAGRDFNSHAPVLEIAERMYAVYEPLRPSLGTRGAPRLTADELRSISAAATGREA